LRLAALGLLGSTLSACLTTGTGGNGVSGGAVVMKQEEKIEVFAAANFEHLKADMARGQGEHLSLFAQLLGIPPEHQAEFCTFTQEKFPVLFPSEHVASTEMVATLSSELSRHPQLLRRVA